MSLKPKLLKQELINALLAADRASAKGTPAADDFDTPQKRKERQVQAEAMATTIIKHIVDNAEVIIPDHPTAVTMTGLGGGPPHVHATNQPPIPHIIGRIK
jgi:hypothetical protein